MSTAMKSSASDYYDIKVDVPPDAPPLQACQGVDNLFARTCNTAFVFPKDSAGKPVDFDFTYSEIDPHVVTFQTILDQTKTNNSDFSLNASATMGFGFLKGSAESNYNKQISYSERTLNIYVQVKAIIKKYVLSQAVLDELKFNDAATGSLANGSFLKNYGDTFVVGCTRGAALNYVASIVCEDEATNTMVSARFSVSGMVNHAQVATDLKWAQGLKGVQVTIALEAQGHLAQPASNSIDDISKFVSDYVSKLNDPSINLSTLDYSLRSYSQFVGFPAVAERTEAEKDALVGLAQRYVAYCGLLNRLNFIQAHPYGFDLPPTFQPSLQAQIGTCEKLRDATLQNALTNLNDGNSMRTPYNKNYTQDGTSLINPMELAKQLPKRLEYYFDVCPVIDPSQKKSVAEIRYKAWNGSLFSVGIIDRLYRHTPLDPKENQVFPLPADSWNWKIPYIFLPGPPEHQNYEARLLTKILAGGSIDDKGFSGGIFSHWDSYPINGPTPDNGFRDRSNMMDFVDDTNTRCIATVVQSAL